MGRGKEKKLWINFDPIDYKEALDVEGYELKVAAQDGHSTFAPNVLAFPAKP